MSVCLCDITLECKDDVYVCRCCALAAVVRVAVVCKCDLVWVTVFAYYCLLVKSCCVSCCENCLLEVAGNEGLDICVAELKNITANILWLCTCVWSKLLCDRYYM